MGTEATVFIVDDEPSVLKSMKWLLESDCLAVRTFTSAEDFLDEFNPGTPGCLILDACMPGMDGLQLQEILVGRGVNLPIIFMTGHVDVPATVQAMKLGAIDFFEKPISDEELLGLVRETIKEDLERYRLERGQGKFR